MQLDMVVGGVGGQGILSIAFVMCNASLKRELHFKQSEVHGMAQRGGAVSSHLRISDQEVFSDLVPLGSAHLVMAVEPMEALRYLEYLAPTGQVVTSTSTEENIPAYPKLDSLLDALVGTKRAVMLNGKKVAKEAGSHRAQNMVVLGATSPYLPLEPPALEEFISVLFAPKGDKLVQTNLNAFRYGRATGEFYSEACALGAEPKSVLTLLDHLRSATLEPAAAKPWAEVLKSPLRHELEALWQTEPSRMLQGTPAVAEALLASGMGSLSASKA
jgi:indolepyruvate ferredoxin oxidoreductase, beta subunit